MTDDRTKTGEDDAATGAASDDAADPKPGLAAASPGEGTQSDTTPSEGRDTPEAPKPSEVASQTPTAAPSSPATPGDNTPQDTTQSEDREAPAACKQADPASQMPSKPSFPFFHMLGDKGKEDKKLQTASIQSITDDLRQRIATLIKAQQTTENQNELARITNLLSSADVLFQFNYLDNLKLAIDSMACTPANIDYAAAVRGECELIVLRSKRGLFRGVYLLAGSTPVNATVSGLGCSLAGLIALVILIGWIAPWISTRLGWTADLHVAWPTLLVMAIMGATGAFVSLLSRLSQLTATRGYDPFLVFATAFFKPGIGVAFACFLFFVLKSGLINIPQLADNGTADTPDLYFVLAFIAGFSERLVSDFITRTGGSVLGVSASAPTGGAAPPGAAKTDTTRP